ncbi:5774_t:CDS:2 [Rhizophagus irregularis]|nr:5774_t:CDS:2 [Rhizophagus irregularis]
MCNTSGWDGKYIHSLLDFLEWVPSLEKVHLHQFLLYLWKKVNLKPMIKVALKRLNGSQNMSK